MSAQASPAPGSAGPPDDPLAEAVRLVDLASAEGLVARVFGGTAVQLRLPGWSGGTARGDRGSHAGKPRDIDLATRGRDSRALARLLESSGYEPDVHHNALYGHKQLYFTNRANGRPVDVVIDALEMCHRLELGGRLEADPLTLPLAELLLSKLQVVMLTRKDAVDALALLGAYPLGETDGDAINLRRIVEVTSNDWGWWRTTRGSVDKLATIAATLGPEEIQPSLDLATQLGIVREALDRAPKSTRWRLRARLGERVRWYEEPEEVQRA